MLVFIPPIPVLPMLATLFLPWERWIPRKVPDNIIGPYLLYCAFAAWYLKMPHWSVVAASLWGIIVYAIAVFQGKGPP